MKKTIQELEAKNNELEEHQNALSKKFDEWEKVFKNELEKARDKAELMRAKIEEDAKKYTGTIDSQAAEIKELKLKLTSKDLEMNDDNL